MKILKLYNFANLKRKMDEWLFPTIEEKLGFQLIKGVDFEKAYKAGSITFEADGIYLEYEGKKYRGYMFIKEPHISDRGWWPRFHLRKCETIQKYISNGRFNQRYEWANTNLVDLIDMKTRKEYKDQKLKYCKYCKQELFGEIQDTEDFFNSLEVNQRSIGDIEVDIYGYVKGWQRISRIYKEKKEYTCEICGIKATDIFDRRYWHVHHRDGNKQNNKLSNLQCVCSLCHAFSDLHHEKNFEKLRMNIELKSFVNKYLQELKRLNNPYLSSFNKKSENIS